MQSFVIGHNLISSSLYGFHKKEFCNYSIYKLSLKWEEQPLTPFSWIIQKYLTCIPFQTLKLHAYGIHYDLKRWFENFLNRPNRNEAVMINGSLCVTLPVISSTLQGYVRSPLLFLIYINDLPNHIPAPVKCLLFAGDAKLSREIFSIADYV